MKRNRRNTIALAIATVILLTLIVGITVCAVGEEYIAQKVFYDVFVNDTFIDFDLPIMSIDNRTYVPLREWCEEINCEVNWNEAEKKVEISAKEGETIIPFDTERKYRLADFAFLNKEMNIADVYTKLGPPDVWEGSGHISGVYYLEDNSKIMIMNSDTDKVTNVYYILPDGTQVTLHFDLYNKICIYPRKELAEYEETEK